MINICTIVYVCALIAESCTMVVCKNDVTVNSFDDKESSICKNDAWLSLSALSTGRLCAKVHCRGKTVTSGLKAKHLASKARVAYDLCKKKVGDTFRVCH